MNSTRPTQLALALFLQTFIIAMVMTLICPRSTKAGFVLRKAHVCIINDLRPDLNLTTHCQSKQSDIGVKVVPYGGNFSFHFRPNFQGTTLFYCSMEWKYSTRKYFDIFDGDRDKHKCRCNRFNWKIRPEGPCMLDYHTAQFDFCYHWNKNPRA